MFEKILIANRGEIACRIMRTAKKMGIHCIAVFSSADAEALHVKMADEAYALGPAPALESYLCGDKIIAIAVAAGAQAIHPGYGFLAENAAFAAACQHAGLCFIGPPVAAIATMGSKITAKQCLEKTAVPLIPGYHGNDQTEATLYAASLDIGFPVLLKAAAGGGGKGMRIVSQAADFSAELQAVKREALASFGDDKVLIEKYLNKPRHIEAQIFADHYDQVVSLFERDCSIQRRHQKVIEEAPAPHVSDVIRENIGKAAIAVAQAVDYVGAGTVEFLLDQNNNFYFMEMNTRLQVEHPITEMITGQDLVAWQLKIAAGERLPLEQKELRHHGHAFEARIYAEDPNNHFLPAVGRLHYLHLPEQTKHVRIDTGVAQGDEISMYYDPLIAKLIVWDENRDLALHRLIAALAQCHVIGVTTNLAFLITLASHPVFHQGHLETGFIENFATTLFPPPTTPTLATLALGSLYTVLQRTKLAETTDAAATLPAPWQQLDNWRLNSTEAEILHWENPTAPEAPLTVKIHHEKTGFQLNCLDSTVFVKGNLDANNQLTASLGNEQITAKIIEHEKALHILTEQHNQLKRAEIAVNNEAATELAASPHLLAPMPGKIVALFAAPGMMVKKGDKLLALEAMKMEHTLYAPSNGSVTEYYFKVGDKVDDGAELLAFAPAISH